MHPKLSCTWTYVGLAIALLAGPGLIAIQTAMGGPVSNVAETLVRELMLFALAGVLVLVILRGERLPLSSVGLRTDRFGKTLLLGLGISLALAATAVAALGLLHIVGLKSARFPGFRPPPVVLTLVIVRAGIVEELFYRGYAIERLQALTGSKWVAAIVPLLFFAAAHFKGGASGMLIALALGAALTFFYMWKRNLGANMIGHFMIDFVPNVLLPPPTG
ncbi:MAG: CPBP family intramembrane glutamic endopeptidase [Sphingomonas sp.]